MQSGGVEEATARCGALSKVVVRCKGRMAVRTSEGGRSGAATREQERHRMGGLAINPPAHPSGMAGRHDKVQYASYYCGILCAPNSSLYRVPEVSMDGSANLATISLLLLQRESSRCPPSMRIPHLTSGCSRLAGRSETRRCTGLESGPTTRSPSRARSMRAGNNRSGFCYEGDRLIQTCLLA